MTVDTTEKTDWKALEEQYVLPTYKKFPLSLERGKGNYVYDENGEKYLDLYAGHAVTILGHNPKVVVDALHAQTDKLLFYSNLVHSRIRAEAARSLVSLCEVKGGKVFFCNSGAEANENAMTIARIVTKRSMIVTTSGSFHGRTAGALGATGIAKYKASRPGLATDLEEVPFGDLNAAAVALDKNAAAFLVEPIQSMAGVIVPPPGYLQGLETLCRARGALLIFDEVQTGLGRTGAPSAAWCYGARPHLQTFAKALGSGVPCGAVVASEEIGASLKPGDLGSTFGGGPLACAAIKATCDEIRWNRMWEQAEGTAAILRSSFKFPQLKEIRGKGLLIGLVFDRPAREIRDALLKEHILVGLSEDPSVVRLLPPLTITGKEINILRKALGRILA
ncbi:MAG: acetylornithine aminotransferase [Elusimicrobia bacterium]|nr:MAG: acetylornithine aminotransferase [Elusimicrobiota bacterium]